MARTAVVSKRLKQVNPGVQCGSVKKKSGRRREREARERLIESNTIRTEQPEPESELARLSEREALRVCNDTEDFDDILELLGHVSAKVRVAALEQVCPCRLRGHDDDDIWEKVISMVQDQDLGVRKQVLHTLCDGSPPRHERAVVEAVETFNSEPDRNLKRMAHKVLA